MGATPRAASEESEQAARSAFLEAVSHALWTPLTSILGYSRTLEKHWDRIDEETKVECIHSIVERGEELKELVDEAIEAAREQIRLPEETEGPPERSPSRVTRR